MEILVATQVGHENISAKKQLNDLSDENRSRVVDGNALSLIIKRLANPRLVAVAVPVLFNICADFGMFYLFQISIGKRLRTDER